MHTIQNKEGISFAGAWLNYGLHEDGFTSGFRAALALQCMSTLLLTLSATYSTTASHIARNDIRPPFEIVDANREPQPALASALFDVLEGTGMRSLLGNVLGFWLDFWSVVLLAVSALFVQLLDGSQGVVEMSG